MASMIYGVSRNGHRGLGYSGPSKPIDESLRVKPIPLFKQFVPAGSNLNDSELKSFDFVTSQTQTQKKNSKFKYHAQIPLDYSTARKSKGVRTSGKTNQKGPRIWVPKRKIIYVADILNGTTETPVMVPGQWMLATHDGRKAYVPRFGT